MKTRFLLGVLLLFSITMQGQQVKVNYENITNSLPIILQEYFRMQGVQHLNLTIKTSRNRNTNYCRISLNLNEIKELNATSGKKISCNNGVFTERELLPDFVHFILVDSVETLDFMIAPYKEDSIRLTCFYPPVDNMPLFTDTVRLDRHKILMETYTPGDGFDIPIISYTSGISVQGGIWFCGLRDSKVEPRKWYEKYGIDDYVYYTIRLEEDKPSSKGTVYVKISK